jgi:NADH:ubiquinone oxidoreductase subunit K
MPEGERGTRPDEPDRFPICWLAVLLFAIGMAGALARRNAILALVGIELMLNAANLSFVVFWRFGPNPDPQTGLMFALFSIAVAAAEAAVGLALIIACCSGTGGPRSLDAADFDEGLSPMTLPWPSHVLVDPAAAAGGGGRHWR